MARSQGWSITHPCAIHSAAEMMLQLRLGEVDLGGCKLEKPASSGRNDFK